MRPLAMRLIDSTTDIEIIPPEECWALLGGQRVGRLVLGVGGGVDIFPVNYGVHLRRIVIRTGDGTKWRDGPGASVAFEVDELEEETRSGWSVVVRGRLDPMDDDGPAGILITPWAGERPHVLLLTADTVTGRRITPF